MLIIYRTYDSDHDLEQQHLYNSRIGEGVQSHFAMQNK